MTRFCSVTAAALLSAVVLLAAATAAAQDKKSDKPKIPDPEPMPLTTKDGVLLQCTYYAGGVVEKARDEFETVPGKEVVPIILLHGWKGQRVAYDALASYLQRLGHAVLVPDLRGHGRSRTQMLPNGQNRELDAEELRPAELATMVLDVEACKKFLLEQNNEGKVNIEMLCVVGADLGAIVALSWADLDWRRPQLPFQKQGRDVKALVLLSPQQSYKGLTVNTALKNPVIMQGLSIMIVVGADDREGNRDARTLYKRFERHHPEPDPKDLVEKKDLFLITKKTSLAGTNLVHPRAPLDVHVDIRRFIHLRLVNKKSQLAWKERKNPLEAEAE